MPIAREHYVNEDRRAVVIDGVRTPFAKAFGPLLQVDTIQLATTCVGALLERQPAAKPQLDAVVWGGVLLPSHAPNVGRELVLDLGLDPSIEAMTVTRACASGLQAATQAAAVIERGEADVVVAGGSDSTSNTAVPLPPKVLHALAPLFFGKPNPHSVLEACKHLWPPSALLPRMPRVAERTTGEVMGESAEKMAASTVSRAKRRTSLP